MRGFIGLLQAMIEVGVGQVDYRKSGCSGFVVYAGLFSTVWVPGHEFAFGFLPNLLSCWDHTVVVQG